MSKLKFGSARGGVYLKNCFGNISFDKTNQSKKPRKHNFEPS